MTLCRVGPQKPVFRQAAGQGAGLGLYPTEVVSAAACWLAGLPPSRHFDIPSFQLLYKITKRDPWHEGTEVVDVGSVEGLWVLGIGRWCLVGTRALRVQVSGKALKDMKAIPSMGHGYNTHVTRPTLPPPYLGMEAILLVS